MAYDEELAQRFRDLLDGMPGISEKKMMGGICFMVDGNMIGGADRTKDGQGRFMFRVGKENQDEAMRRFGGEVMEMGGRKMSGFFFIDENCGDERLKEWVVFAHTFASSLPPK
mgnify:CR=1 FL=1